MTVEQPCAAHPLTITVDLRPGEFAAVNRFRVTRTTTWRVFLGPVVLLASRGVLPGDRHRGPLRLGRIAVELLLAVVAAETLVLVTPSFVGARWRRRGAPAPCCGGSSAGAAARLAAPAARPANDADGACRPAALAAHDRFTRMSGTTVRGQIRARPHPVGALCR